MSDLRFDIDVDSIASSFGEMKKKVDKDLKKAVGALASMTHAKTIELANNELKSLAGMYTKGLSFQQLEDNLWVVSLDEKLLWIEEGRKCVVYGNNKSHIPKVLTPDGEIPITDLKIGMLVLNQYGKWTDVVDIYDEHLVEKSKLITSKIQACRYTPKNHKLHKREYIVNFQTKCPVCNDIKLHKKINNKRQNNSYCTKCLKNQGVYKVEISGHLNKKYTNWSTMFLTHDHQVMTQDGWKKIKDVNQSLDSLIIPSWSECKECKKDTLFGSEFCYDSEGGRCSSSYYVKKTLKEGKHWSQQPNSRVMYLKRLLKTQKYNKTLLPILKNHSNEIKMMSFNGFRVTKKEMKSYSPINRRWDITVREGESFICNKIVIHNSGFMEELLNGKSSKTNKDGERYAVIPFEHSKNPSEQSSKARELTNQIKEELKSKNINYRKVEYNQDGSPRIGLLHRFNVESARLKDTHKDEPLKGVAIYQRMNKETGRVQRDVMTFRVITEKHREEGKWVHPGRSGDKLMDKAFKWATEEWEQKILPEVLGKYA